VLITEKTFLQIHPMKKNILFFSAITIFLLSLSLFFTMGCQRDKVISDPGINEPVVNDNEIVVGGIRGTVINENNQPVVGAIVSSGTNTTMTDSHGSFSFSNINLSKANGYVKVTKTGYFNGSRSFISNAGRIHTVRIKLLPKTNAGNFAAASGGTITIGGGAKLVLPANAMTDASGNSYTGTVNVAMTWIDPTSADLPNILPGDLRGILIGGQERGLSSYGMLGVELTDGSSQSLKIATGKTAELTFPIPSSLQASAPAKIDLWNFDEATGRWKQDGTATRSGSYYIAQVSHFSFWNCDAQFPIIEACMNFVIAGNNNPLNNVQVRIKRPNGTYGYGRTDSIGNLCAKVPKDEALVLEVLGQCSNMIYSQNIGPFSSDASLGTISVTVPPINLLTITGTLTNCNNANVTSGTVILYTGNANSYTVPVNNGAFSFTILHCDNTPVNYTLQGFDYATLQQGFPVNGTATTGTVNAGTVQACGTASSQYIQFLVDGLPIAYTEPPNNIYIIDSSFAGNNNMSIHANGVTPSLEHSFFKFAGNGSTGAFPLLSCIVSGDGGGEGLATIMTSNPIINITTFGPIGTGYVEGNFTVLMSNGVASPFKNVVCTFRVRRD
jgi:hypothetical protein